MEVAIELTAQELLAPPCVDGFVEIDDIAAIMPLPTAAAAVANADRAAAGGSDESVEIELTAADMDELLRGGR
jgi:hypothetical protein